MVDIPMAAAGCSGINAPPSTKGANPGRNLQQGTQRSEVKQVPGSHIPWPTHARTLPPARTHTQSHARPRGLNFRFRRTDVGGAGDHPSPIGPSEPTFCKAVLPALFLLRASGRLNFLWSRSRGFSTCLAQIMATFYCCFCSATYESAAAAFCSDKDGALSKFGRQEACAPMFTHIVLKIYVTCKRRRVNAQMDWNFCPVT